MPNGRAFGAGSSTHAERGCSLRAAAPWIVWTALCASCAVPVAPTGGPPDREPPQIESIVPASGAVNVSSGVIRISFNEYINESSFLQALSITPEPATRPDIHWRKRTVEIQLRDELEPNTTYILTIDTKLRDSHGVSLAAPITQAFSTGPEINRGTIRGTVVEPLRGTGQAGIQVFAYTLPDSARLDSLPQRPLYRTETDASGEFHFEYLSTRPYFVLAVRDLNGNRRPDNQEVIAVPPAAAISADTTENRVEHPWVTTVLDTIAPEIRRVDGIDVQHLAVRYSEDISIDPSDSAGWRVSDSLQQRMVTVQHVYQVADDRRTVYVQTARLRPGSYVLTMGVVTDSTGNRSTRVTRPLRITSPVEPPSARFVSFIPALEPESTRLHPTASAGVQFDRPLTEDEVRRRLTVEDTAGVALDYAVTSSDGVRQHLVVDRASDGYPFRVTVDTTSPEASDSTATQLFTFLTSRDLGAIVGVIDGLSNGLTVDVDAIGAPEGTIAGSTSTSSGGAFSIGQLEVGGYHLRVRRDDNGNGRWDGGAIRPFTPAERLYWRPDSVRVRARWDTDVDTLRTSIING